ncbi:MAG: class I SAM-dependent methyltransferase [Syntrophotaleaceae bacterium]
MKAANGLKEDGIVAGNNYNKYGSRNPVVKTIMAGFSHALMQLVDKSSPKSIHDVGCGEGFWVLEWARQGRNVRGTDFSSAVIDLAKKNAIEHGLEEILFETRSIYDLDPSRDSADLIVCIEVLEHLHDPETALERLQSVVDRHLIVSVPHEPVWRLLNIVRGKYLDSMGNTPGHVQHWSRGGFVQMISKYFEVVEVKKPLPWTMLLCQSRV